MVGDFFSLLAPAALMSIIQSTNIPWNDYAENTAMCFPLGTAYNLMTLSRDYS